MKQDLRKAFEIIKHFEGKKLQKYYCPAGKPTIGYGHVITEDEDYEEITEEVAEQLLMQDIEKFADSIHSLVEVPLVNFQFCALVSFAYNVGTGAFAKSTLLRKINNGDYLGAKDEFRRWVYTGGKKLNGLIARREAESNLFMGKDWWC